MSTNGQQYNGVYLEPYDGGGGRSHPEVNANWRRLGDIGKMLWVSKGVQTITDDTLTTLIGWDDVDTYSDADMWDAFNITTGIFSPPISGKYLYVMNVEWEAGTTGYRYVVDNAGWSLGNRVAGSTFAIAQTPTFAASQVAGVDQSSVKVRHTEGGDLDVTSAFLNIVYLGA